MQVDVYDSLTDNERWRILMRPECDPLNHLCAEDDPGYMDELRECYLMPSQIAHFMYANLPRPYQRAVNKYKS